MKTIDIIDNFSDLDRVRFEQRDEYVEYFNFIKNAFNQLIDSLKSRTTDNPIEIAILKEFLQKYLNTVELLRLKYLYDSDDKMAIDLTDSSFPNYLEFKKIDSEANKVKTLINSIPGKDALKQEVLDYFFEKKAQPIHLLKKLGQAEYYSALEADNYMKLFTDGSLYEIGKSDNGNKKFIYNWSSYDSMTNRPHIYIMVFEFTNPTVNLAKEGAETFKKAIEKLNHDSSPLSVIAKDIDNTFESVKPKVLKRIDIGPIYCRYSKDKHDISNVIQEKFEDDDYAFFYTTEIVHSVGEKEVKKGGFMSRETSLRQVFFVDKTDKDSLERHVSEVSI
jgi:copper chaperone CopZ